MVRTRKTWERGIRRGHEPTEHKKRRTSLQINDRNSELSTFYFRKIAQLSEKSIVGEAEIQEAIRITKEFARTEGINWRL